MSEHSPKPAAEGTLSRQPFAHLLLYMLQQGLTGTLIVWPDDEPDGIPDRILFHQGSPIAGRLADTQASLELGLLPMFARTTAKYAFYADFNYLGEGPGIRRTQVDVYTMIAAALRGGYRDDVVDQVVARFDGRKVRLKPGVDLSRYQLQQRELAFTDLLRADPSSVEQLVQSSGLQAKVVRRLVYLLAITKNAEPYDPTAARGLASPLAPSSPGTTPSPIPPSPDSQPAAPAPRASIPPAMGRSPSSPTNIAVKPEAPPKIKKGPPSVPPPPPTLSPEHLAFWEEIRSRAGTIENQNYFEMLGLKPEGTTSTMVRDAYFELAKKWHPDRLPRELSSCAPAAQMIFRYLSEANDHLGDDKKRESYMNLVKGGGGTPAEQRKMQGIVEAAMEFQKAEVMLKRKDLDAAMQMVRTALDLNPEEGDYHALFAWILFQRHTGLDAPMNEMLAAVDTALRINDKSDRAHYYKGMMLKRMGKTEEAGGHFRIAAKLNKKNVDAIREMRLAEMRGVDTRKMSQSDAVAASGKKTSSSKVSIPPGRPGSSRASIPAASSGQSLLSKIFPSLGGSQKKK